MARPSIVVICAGGMGLLIALFLLWRSTRSEALPADAPTQPAPVATTNQPAPAAPSIPAARPAARVGKVGGSAAPSPSRGTPGAAPSLTAAPEVEAPAERVPNNDNLHFGKPQLVAQTAAVEPLVRECVEKAVTAGHRPTGKAVLTFFVAKQGDKYVIEDTGFDSEATTLQNEGLIECLHQTARAMKFEGLPRRSTSIVVNRTVTLEDGALSDYKYVSFSYLR